jgi:hypothetical protein
MQTSEFASLALVLDEVNDANLFGTPLPAKRRREIAIWLAGRQGLPGSYADMFAPTPDDYANSFLFTGEPIASRAATEHILGEEAMRALVLLDIHTPAVAAALSRARDGMETRLAAVPTQPVGKYCCGTCSCAYWRNLTAGGLTCAEERLSQGMKELRRRRLDTGKWRIFPFFYTILALSEIDLPAAREELRYAAPVLEGYLRRCATIETTSRRRHAVAKIALSRC